MPTSKNRWQLLTLEVIAATFQFTLLVRPWERGKLRQGAKALPWLRCLGVCRLFLRCFSAGSVAGKRILGDIGMEANIGRVPLRHAVRDGHR